MELDGVSDYIPYNLWAIMFLEKQGYKFRDNVLFQDNQSSILIEKNGRSKGGPLRTYHGSRYIGGYSDHFPVYAILQKNY